jgi:hypothetical protein
LIVITIIFSTAKNITTFKMLEDNYCFSIPLVFELISIQFNSVQFLYKKNAETEFMKFYV